MVPKQIFAGIQPALTLCIARHAGRRRLQRSHDRFEVEGLTALPAAPPPHRRHRRSIRCPPPQVTIPLRKGVRPRA